MFSGKDDIIPGDHRFLEPIHSWTGLETLEARLLLSHAPPLGPGMDLGVTDPASEAAKQELDFGDAPDDGTGAGYPTLAISNGANHVIVAGGPLLGNLVDSDRDGQPNADATGDDTDPDGDDEDGVIIPALYEGLATAAQVTVQGGPAGRAVVEAWFDWNRDKIWQPSELVFSHMLATGVHPVLVMPPAGTGTGETFARFRISANGVGSPEGPAADGEVEDYKVLIHALEIDHYDAAWGQIDLRHPHGTHETVELTGPVQTHVYFEGPLEGDAGDDDGDELDEVQTEMVDMDLSGDSSLGTVHVRLHTGPRHPGEMEEGVNVNPGRLDVQPFLSDEGYWVESFFDITYEIDLPDQGMVLHALAPKHLAGVLHHKPAAPGDTYTNDDLTELFDGGGNPSGFFLGPMTLVPNPPQEELDWGDAPDPQLAPGYPTLAIHGGANHIIGGPWLGDAGDMPDAEPDGQQNANATGDDTLDLNDDEDGVKIPVLTQGVSANITYEVSNTMPGGAYVDGWIDWNADNTWDASEKVLTAGPLPDGIYTVPVTPPVGSVIGQTFARFRINSRSNLPPTGGAADGEVEDHAVRILEGVSENTKWVQWPDITPEGMDIRVDEGRWLADDFECTDTSQLTDVHLWCSWLDDAVGEIENIHLSVHSDDPVGPGGTDPDNQYSMPDDLLWEGDFSHGEFDESLYYKVPEGEYWWDPARGDLMPRADHEIWRIDINIDPAFHDIFVQTGTPERPVIYWLDVQVDTLGGQIGWKTRRWPEHFMDDAVWDQGSELPRNWKEMRYPDGHRYEGYSIDMAFALTFEDVELDWGDAPDSTAAPGYPTLAIHNGANHVIAGPWLGDANDMPDAEPEGQPNGNATGDDLDVDGDDENGVSIPVLIQGGSANITYEVSNVMPGGAYVDGWIDWNGDNTWDAGEKVLTTGALPDGIYTFTVTPPAGSVVGQTFARFRINSRSNIGPTGGAADGEVEDYQVTIYQPEIDVFPNTWGQLTIEREVPDGSKIIIIDTLELRGFSQWQVFIGPDGQAADTDGDELDQVETEIVEMDLAGDSWMGPLTVNLYSTSPAPGEMEEMENNTPGTLDVQPFTPEGLVESFFDITYQFKPAEFKDQDPQILHTEVPLRYAAVISHKPPRAGESYVTVPGQSVELFDESGQPVGIRIIGGVYVSDPVWDFGDAPDDGSGLGYPTLAISNGACHVITADGPWLGDAADMPDAEPNGQPDPNALGDDNDADGDDEDGVKIPVLTQGQTASITYEVNGASLPPGGAYVDGWIDWNGDKTWDASEKVLTAGPLPDGIYTVPVTPPVGSVIGQTFARFRINSRSNLGPTGGAADGEVEDHAVRILEGVPENTKWVQWPDITPEGMDIRVDEGRWLADDFECTDTSQLTDVHLWCSWLDDAVGEIENIHLSVHSDDPVGPGGTDPDNQYSMPDDLLWEGDFSHGEFDDSLYYKVPEGEYWWDPASGDLIPGGDHEIWRIDINIDPAFHDLFIQTGTPERPVIYWLDVQVESLGGQIGWKTRRWPEHFMDDAVWDYGIELPREWKEMRYPHGHPYHGLEDDSIDMAFALTFEEVELDFGDAPDDGTGAGYPTLAISNGANHAIAGPWLGGDTNSPDADPDGQPDPNALGDDNDADGDDEDGVNIPILTQGQPATITVEVNDGGTGIGGVLEAWIDWNGDKAWDASEIIHNTWLPGGVHPINVTPPAAAVVGQTFGRFRISTRGGLTWEGAAPDGEVEDHEVLIEESPKHELGDAPDSTNSFPPLTMTAYPDGTPARFPTVYQAGSPPHGPIHWNPDRVAFLGPGVTLENEADIGPDQDGPNNIDPPTGLPDQDGRDDGVHFPLNLTHAQWTTFDFDVTAVAMPPGNLLYVNVWFDWRRNGQWDDTPTLPDGTTAPEWAVQDQMIALPGPGIYTYTTDPFVVFQPHPNEGEPIWMRITLSEQPHVPSGTDPGTGGSGPVDGYEYGETEDYCVEDYIEDEIDFGDAPEIPGAASYPTTLANNGARHIIGGPWLGDDTDSPDADPDGQPDLNALGDDNDADGDDEDGVTVSPLAAGQRGAVMVRINDGAGGGGAGGAYLDAWIDFNGDKVWQAVEQIPSGWLSHGPHILIFPVPAGSAVGQTFGRFRVNSRGPGLAPTGPAPDGEVEDHEFWIHELPDNTKWVQWPDLTPHGIDIKVDGTEPRRVLADDFLCTQNSLLTDVHLWGSWLDDRIGEIENVHLSIHADDPRGPGGMRPDNDWSMPGELLWEDDLAPDAVELFYELPEYREWWWDPMSGVLLRDGDSQVWRIDIKIDPAGAFRQYGTPEEPRIYWLDVNVDTLGGEFGWKTRQFPDHFADDAVWWDGQNWRDLHYPADHPYGGSDPSSVDMAFMLTFEEIPDNLDFGDAPESVTGPAGYPTLAWHNGARHIIGGPWLGDDTDSPDADPDGQPDPLALGDDTWDLNDDEDGVSIPRLTQGHAGVICVEVNDGGSGTGGFLDAWIDWNGNRNWELGEQIFAGWLRDGIHMIPVTVPVRPAIGQTFGRFRISLNGGLAPTGPAPDGEVEDHEVIIIEDTVPPTLDAWYSAVVHGHGVGEVVLQIPDTGDFSEPRVLGVSKLRLEFSEAVDPASFAAASVRMAGNDADGNPVDLTGIAVTASAPGDHTVGIIQFAPALPDIARYIVQVDGVTDVVGNPLAGDNNRVFTALIGDAKEDLRINAIDLSYIWPHRTTLIDGVSEDQTRSDVTSDGRVNAIDLSATWPHRGENMYGVPDPVPPPKLGGVASALLTEDALAEAAAFAAISGEGPMDSASGPMDSTAAPAAVRPAGNVATAAPAGVAGVATVPVETGALEVSGETPPAGAGVLDVLSLSGLLPLPL